jgi:hypothetical protein
VSVFFFSTPSAGFRAEGKKISPQLLYFGQLEGIFQELKGGFRGENLVGLKVHVIDSVFHSTWKGYCVASLSINHEDSGASQEVQLRLEVH